MNKTLTTLAAALLFAGCDGRRQDAGVTEADDKPVRRFVEVYAVSAYLPAASKPAATAQLQAGVSELINHAAPGSTMLVFDATECRLVASLKAVPGAPRV